jgi:8-oxo-dGTP diphosphatase
MYAKARIAVDPVIFTISDTTLKVLLQKREKEPFKNKYELLGGLIDQNEGAKETLKRKLKEVLDTDKFFFKQFHTFTWPKRDPRERIISIAYVALIEKNNANNKNWFEINDLPSLAFDHKEIIERAKENLKENIDLFAKH